MDFSQPVLVADNLWWVGNDYIERNLQCNPYLLIKDSCAILFDPGSVLDFAKVYEKVTSLIAIDKLEAIVCSHQDPDLCSALPLFEKAGFTGVYCCHQRAANIITYYGITQPFYIVDFHDYVYTCGGETIIRFLPAPYLHFPGAIMSYLPAQKTLISGDLFGAISTQWDLFAHDDYEEGMKTYHEAYMPSHDILKPVMDQLSNYEIAVICPQHGSIITQNTAHYIDILRNLPCGIFLNPVHKQLLTDGGHLALCNQIVKRYIAIYGASEVRKALAKSEFIYSPKRKLIEKTSYTEAKIWDEFFTLIHERKGMDWITIVAPFVELLCNEYSITLPDVYQTLVFQSHEKLAVKDSLLRVIGEQKSELEIKMHRMEESLFRDPVTGLYNENFHQVFIKETMDNISAEGDQLQLVMMSIDNLAQINLDFGSAEGDAIMKRLAIIMNQRLEPTSQAFRFAGAVFGIYCSKLSREEVIYKANNLITFVSESEAFIVPITLSVGVFSTEELPQKVFNDSEQMKNITIQTARYRLKLAQKRGGGLLVSESVEITQSNNLFTILIIDNPGLGRDLIKRALEKEQYRVITVDDGLKGRRAIAEELPDLIISELMIPKVNALTLRKELLAKPATRNIPFLLMSSSKNESTVERALDVLISHFFWRPVMMVELLGVVKLIAKRLQIQGK